MAPGALSANSKPGGGWLAASAMVNHEHIGSANTEKSIAALVSIEGLQRARKDESRSLAIRSNRASSLAIMLGMANRFDNARLQAMQSSLEARFSAGELALREFIDEVDAQGNTVSKVVSRVDEQAQAFALLEKEIEEHGLRMEQLAAEGQATLAEQRAALAAAHGDLTRSRLSRARRDLLLNAAILIIAAGACRSPLLGFPDIALAKLVKLATGKSSRLGPPLAAAVRVAYVLLLARAMRVQATRMGMHSGSTASALETYIVQACLKVVGAVDVSNLITLIFKRQN